MKKLLTGTVFVAVSLLSTVALAGDVPFASALTVAVFGDWPYNQNLLTNAPLLINSVNGDRNISLVIHVGDIHSGSMACTSAGILPPIPTSNPGWNDGIYHQFQQFKKPVVYTPGDNEWTDCHKTKEFKSGAPLNELAAVRNLFFARPGHSLGGEDLEVSTQAKDYDQRFPEDAAYVENVMWDTHKIVFVTLNLPGSNNDTLPWTNGFEDSTAHDAEVAQRTAADIRWMQAAFNRAARVNARVVVIALQADMWDPAALAPGGDGLSAYTPFVQALADASVKFGRQVILLNGDSHLYEADQPLANPQSPTGQIHHTQAVINLTRVTVQGSTNAPAEWLRLTIDPNASNGVTYTNVPYCKDPLTSCQ